MTRAFVHLLAIAAVAGALAAVVWPIAATSALAVAIAAAALAVPVASVPGRHGLLVFAVAALAASHAASVRDAVLAPQLGLWFAANADTSGAVTGGMAAGHAVATPQGNTPIRVRGVLEADAARTAGGLVRLRVFVRDVDVGAGWIRAPGRIAVHVQGDAALREFSGWTQGRHVVAPTSLRWPPVLRNPGGSSPMRQRLTRGYVLTGTIKSAALIDVSAAPWWHEAAAAVRRYVRRTARAVFAPDRPTTAAIVTAILIGDRNGIDADLTDRLVEAGTYHVVAISGGNVAIVTLVVVLGLRHMVRSPRATALVALLVVAAYGWLVGAEPSVQRAVTMACLWLGAESIGIRAPAVRAFSVVSLVIVIVDPLIVVMPGAWLSFGATFGILMCAERMAVGVAQALGTGTAGMVRRLAVVASGLGAATIAAELMLWPIGAWMFSRVSVAGIVLNFLAVPAMTVVQVSGVVAVALFDVWAFGAGHAGQVAHVATRILLESARLVEWVPSLAWRVPPPPVFLVASYYMALSWILSGWGSPRAKRVASAIAVVVLVVMAAPGGVRGGPPRGTLRATFLDVGQGDAVVVQFPSGQVLVVDAGAAGNSFDSGERIVMPALWALGVQHVDWIAFTHADADHIGGVTSVLAQFDVGEIWEGVPVPRDARRAALRTAGDKDDVVWRSLRSGDRWELGGAVLDVLHPPVPDWERQRVRNDDSLVFRIRHGDLELLLTGDVGQPVERELVARDDGSRMVRVLKVAHHGSRGSSSAEFVNAYQPWAAVVSAGRNNPFGHPTPEVLARLGHAGATILRTDRDGAVMIESDGRAVSMRTWAGRHWRVTTAGEWWP